MPIAQPSPRPPALVVVCVIVLVEAVALVAAGVVGVLSLGAGAHVGPVAFLVVLALGAAAVLAAAVRGLWGGRRWGRGPVLTAQLLAVVTAATWWGAGGGPLALVPIVLALVAGVALLTPAVVTSTSSTGRAG